MNTHEKYLLHFTQNIKSDNEITKYFLDQERLSGTIIRCELEKGVEMLFFDYYLKEDQETDGFEKSNFLEIFYCLRGNVELKYDTGSAILLKNMIGIYDFNTCPNQVILQKGNVKGISLLLDIDQADIVIRKHLSQKTLTMKQFQERIEKQMQLFFVFGNENLRSVFLSIAENPFDYDKEYLLLKALELVLISSNSIKREGINEAAGLKRTADYQIFERAVTCLEFHISEPIIIQELAKELGITERRLNRCFMDHAGQTAYSYLKALRLQKGKQLLSQTNMTVTEIAGEAGWQNASKFAGAFRTKYGMTPIEYRKQNKFV